MTELFADRFLVSRDRRAIDLASGEEVALIRSAAGGPSDERRWATRCDWLFGVRHRALAELADYGPAGETERFEAWQCGPVWRGARDEGRRALDLAGEFLRACNKTGGEAAEAAIRTRNGRPIVLPSQDAGYPIVSVPADVAIEALGITITTRAAVSAITEVLEDAIGVRARVLCLSGRSGAGLTTAVSLLARAARLRGYIPAALSVLDEDARSLLANRSLLVLASSDQPALGWRTFLEWMLESPKSHLILFTGQSDVPKIRSLQLSPLTPAALAAAITPEPSGPLQRHIESAARRADGLPGRFTTLLWGPRSVHRAGVSTLSRAAEQPAAYGNERTVPARLNQLPHDWPAPGQLNALKRKLTAAITLVEGGRHAPGERTLRAVAAALARRHAWHDAASGALSLARSLLRRGRPRDAQDALADAKEFCRRAALDGHLLDVAILSGTAWTDVGRLEEAENVLISALAAARSADEPGRTSSGRLALARCLFWRGRYDDARRTLIEERAGDLTIQRDIALSRIAVGTRELDLAIATAVGALDWAERSGNRSLVADAACACAFAHLAVGDGAALRTDVATAVRAARAARDPLCALKARLLFAEHERRAGRPAIANALVERLRKFPSGTLPATVAIRSAVLAELMAGAPAAEVIRRHVAATGFGALALFAPEAGRSSSLGAAADDLVEILRACQMGDDDRRALQAVSALIRRQTRATAAGFFGRDRTDLRPVAVIGGRLDPEFAARVAAVGQVIAPRPGGDVIESGAPIRSGGEIIGALVVRWTVDAACDAARASLLLSTAAAAAAPSLAGAMARQSDGSPRDAGEILGLSTGIEQVRKTIQRAAAAPFAVLIAGESGCGKELVARALHRQSPRRDRAFCTLNCAALPDDLVEAELFGHARGAFTGAVAERPGVFEEAHTGTLFLDEIGELSPRAQAKVLRTIQEGEVRRVGENVARRVDVRIVSATNRDLATETSQGRFRLDLLYRLDVVRITVPPLRERREDIAVLVERFWRDAVNRTGSRAVLGAAAVAALARYDWPGNVRELQNVLAALAVRSPRRGVIPATALPPAFGAAVVGASMRLDEARKTFDEQFIRAALVRSGGHRARAAHELGLSRQGLTKLMARLGIFHMGSPAAGSASSMEG
jgi:DNA-binding NtrC family response regulator/tetratricopeptide (TPR) repeat protein